MLRPAGGGLYVVSTGRAEQLAVQRALYGVADEAAIHAAFVAALDRVATARAVILGVPSDVGAGFRRGASFGPQGIRSALQAREADLRGWMDRHDVIDIGDVFVIPQLLDDAMLAPAQIAASRAAIYAGVAPGLAATLPVAPLSIEKRALDSSVRAQSGASCRSCLAAITRSPGRCRRRSRASPRSLGIVQPDAHTDLLAERLGIRTASRRGATTRTSWLGRDGRLVQVGVRASRHDRAYWERGLGVRQFWARSAARPGGRARPDARAPPRPRRERRSISPMTSTAPTRNCASATGTPEAAGLTPDWVMALVDRLGREIGFCAADCVEVAPPLGPTAAATKTTVDSGRALRPRVHAAHRRVASAVSLRDVDDRVDPRGRRVQRRYEHELVRRPPP